MATKQSIPRPTPEAFIAGRDLAVEYIRSTYAAEDAVGDDPEAVTHHGLLRPFLRRLAADPSLVDGFDAVLSNFVMLTAHSTPNLEGFASWSLADAIAHAQDHECGISTPVHPEGLRRIRELVAETLPAERRVRSDPFRLMSKMMERSVVVLEMVDAATEALPNSTDSDRSEAILAGLHAYLLESDRVQHSMGAALVVRADEASIGGAA